MPANEGYLVAAYAALALLYGGYAVWVLRRRP
jgi:hypothetical protein